MNKHKRGSLILFCVILFLIWLIVAFSCSPTKKLQRAEKLIKEAEAKGAKWHRDTVYTERAVFLPGKSVTNFIPVHHYRDTTFTVYKDRVKIQNKFIHDTLFQQIDCPDTVIRWKERTTINNAIVAPPCPSIWKGVGYGSGGVLLLLIILGLLRLFSR